MPLTEDVNFALQNLFWGILRLLERLSVSDFQKPVCLYLEHFVFHV